MPDVTETDAAVEQLAGPTTDEEALAIEGSLIEETDSSLQDGDPEEQPDQEPPVSFAPPTTEMERVIARAESQIGTVESPAGSNRVLYSDWYGLVGPWCAMYVSWCFALEGRPLAATTSKGFASTVAGASWFKKQGRWSTTPARGHVVFFDFPGDGVNRISHIGIVAGVNGDGSIETVEGNTDEKGGRTGGKVMRRRRKVGIVGYGTPRYDTSSSQPQENRQDVGSAPGPAAPITTEPTLYPEDHMKSHPLAISLDDQGRGYGDLPGLPAAKVTSVVVNGADPAASGRYTRGFSGPEVLNAGGNTRVVLKANEPGKGRIDLTVWSVD